MKERESEKEYRERQKEIGQSRGIRAHFASALIIIKGSQASIRTHGGIQQDKCNSFTLILSAFVCVCVYAQVRRPHKVFPVRLSPQKV